MKNEIFELLRKIQTVKHSSAVQTSYPNGCYSLDKNNILAGKSIYGHSRYPYFKDGLTLWAYDTGYIAINESTFFLVAPTLEGKEPYMAFYGGIKNAQGTYDFYSITGVADSFIGSKKNTNVIFNSTCAYYIREIDNVIFSAKLTISDEKTVLISLSAINNGSTTKEIYLSSYQCLMMMHSLFENEEMKWFRDFKLIDTGCYAHGVEDISREIHLNNYSIIKYCTHNITNSSKTTSNIAYRGSRNNQLNISPSLENGEFPFQKNATGFSESATYGDIHKATLRPNEEAYVDYEIFISFNKEEIDEIAKTKLEDGSNEKKFSKLEKDHIDLPFSLKFGKFKNSDLNEITFNNFISNVVNQVNYCTCAKVSSLKLLGMRDVFQMIEASSMFNPKAARDKILLSMNFIEEGGRIPRQFSIPQKDENPEFDKREFIDQGQWIISAIYQYLAFNNDKDLLFEETKFVDIENSKFTSKKSTVLDHLKCIIKYLIGNIDSKTGCLRTLYGDWNDAVDGLGKTNKKDQKFGDGVSGMATFHLYKNINEMIEILNVYSPNDELLPLLNESKKSLLKNATSNCVVLNKDKEERIVHGWGENQSFYIGSFKDVDGESRLSTTSHAFYVISGLNKDSKNMKECILSAFDKLDSKYGIKTFDKYFDKSNASEVGRIVNLPKGTAENAATYIHGAMFAVRAYFLLNEGEKGFSQLLKLIPITHKNISVSSFIMPNSYGYNEEIGVDGESMNDWYTGSSNTLLKALVFDMLGINPKLDNTLEINTINELPSNEITLDLLIKGKRIKYTYINSKSNARSIIVNDTEINTNIIDLNNYNSEEIAIKVID